MTAPVRPTTLPLHMRRDRFSPDPELAEHRTADGIPQVRTAFGADAFLVTRYDDVREVLGDAVTYSNAAGIALRRPKGPQLSAAEIEAMRAGNLLAPAGPVPPSAFRAYHFVYGMHTLPVTW